MLADTLTSFFHTMVYNMQVLYWMPIILPLISLMVYIGYRLWIRKTKDKDQSKPKKADLEIRSSEQELVFRSSYDPEASANIVLDQQGTEVVRRPVRAIAPLNLDDVVGQDLSAMPLNDRLSNSLITQPVVISCGEVFGHASLITYMMANQMAPGVYVSPAPYNQPFFSTENPINSIRTHVFLEKLRTWVLKQNLAKQHDIMRNPVWFFFEEGDTLKPILENIGLLMGSSQIDFMETWYDESVFFQDPVIDEKGNTVEFPVDDFLIDKKKVTCYNDLYFSKDTTLLSQFINMHWVKIKGQDKPRALSEYITPRHDNTLDSLLSAYFPDRITYGLIQKVKPYCKEYADYYGLSAEAPLKAGV